FSFAASVEEPPPAGAKLVVIWTVTSETPNYSYAFGSGSVSETKVIVSLSSGPPAEALTAGKVGVGILAFVGGDDSIPDGKLASDQFAVSQAWASRTTTP